MAEDFTSGSFGEMSDSFSKFHDYQRMPFKGAGYSVLYTVLSGGRKLFLKALNRELGASAEHLARLRREYWILEKLYGNEHVVRCIGWREDAEVGPCIVMEYIDGATLSDFLKTSPSHKEKKRILGELLDAMAFVHSHQVVHNDLKPANILITRNGHNVKLIDFGYADSDSNCDKATGGTEAFAAPELANREQTDVTSDIFSLGFVIKALFPHRYGGVVRKCQRKKASKRHKNINEVRKALRFRDYLSRWVSLLVFVVPLLVWFLTNKTINEKADKQLVADDEIQTQSEIVTDTVFVVEERHDTIKVEVPIKPKLDVVHVQIPVNSNVPTDLDQDSFAQVYLELYQRAELESKTVSPLLFLDEKSGLFGYEDRNGKEVVPAIYQDAKAFKDGYAVCCFDGKYGLVAPDGCQYLFNYREILTLEKDYHFYIGRKRGRSRDYVISLHPLPVETEYDDVDLAFSKNGIVPVRKLGRYGYIGIDGKELEKPIFKHRLTFNQKGFALAETDEGYGVVNVRMEHVTNLNYPYGKITEEGTFLLGQFEYSFGVVNGDGKMNIEAGTYARTTYLESFAMILAKTEDGFYTIIDINGRVIVPKSESITVLEGIAIIKNGDDIKCMDLSLLKNTK